MAYKIRGWGKIRGAYDRLRDRESEWRRDLWQLINNPSGPTTPVFLIGCGRSGTSMVVHHLNRSMKCKLYNEDNPEAFERWRLREFKVIDHLIERSHAEFTMFKPILNSYQAELFLSRYPAAKVIFSFRHYHDVINSSLKRFGRQNRLNHVRAWVEDDFEEFADYPPPMVTREFVRKLWKTTHAPESGGALYWLFQNRLYYDLHLDQDPRVLLVGYEKLVFEPEDQFRKICHFLGLPFEPEFTTGIYDSSIGRDDPPEIDPDIHRACEELWDRLTQQTESQPMVSAP